MKTDISIAGAISSNSFAFDFGVSRTASETAIAAQANAFTEAGIRPDWIPVDAYKDANVIHLEVFNQVAAGRYKDDTDTIALLKTTKKELAKLSADQKKLRENASRTVRRDVMAFLTQVRYCMLGQSYGSVAASGRPARTEWQLEERVIGGLMAIRDALSGTDNLPATQFMLEVQKLLDPAIDKLASQHDKAKAVKTGFGQKYKGAFSVSKKK